MKYKVLRNKNYRNYFATQLLSTTGTMMQAMVQAWLAYRLTHQGYWLGIITVCTFAPAFLLTPVVGVWIDRANSRKILLLAETIAMLQALTLAYLTLSGQVQVWHIAVLALVDGVVGALDTTARHVFVYDMVGKEDLPRALGLNTATINLARVLGPTLGGIAVGVMGEGKCFLLNGLSYMPSLFVLWFMKAGTSRAQAAGGAFIKNLKEGLKYVAADSDLSRIMLLSGFVCLVASPVTAVLQPVFAKKVLNEGPHMLAALSACLGLGSILGSMLFDKVPSSSVLMRHVVTWGTGLLLLGASRLPALSAIAMFAIGYYMMNVFPALSGTVQQRVDDDKRGRVMSLYSMTFLGTMPLGSFIQGAITDRYGAPAVALGAGCLMMLGGVALNMGRVARKSK